MINAIRHAIRVVGSLRREAAKRSTRSPEWPRVERSHLAAHPTCAACGGAQRCQVHHEQPFHLRPELELDPTNLVTLCMGPSECHIRIGHGDDFHHYNPAVIADAAEALAHPDRRPIIEARARAGRLPL